jgi:uncharacterized protein (TIGR02271 family)
VVDLDLDTTSTTLMRYPGAGYYAVRRCHSRMETHLTGAARTTTSQEALRMPDVDELQAWHGRNLIDRDGDKVGSIENVYLDEETGRPEWLTVKTGLFGTRETFVPSAEARAEGHDVRVPYEKAHVKDAPNVDADGALSQEEESRLYRHYGLGYTERTSDSGLPAQGSAGTVGRDVSGPETDNAMTRSEEEVRVGTTRRETGRARLRKYVVTENVTKTVPVSREEVRVEREPITDSNLDDALDGPDISEEEHEVTLHAEEPVVEKRAVPKERVRMDRDTVTDEETVSEEVRKERIEAEGDVTRGERFRTEDEIARDRR